MSTYALTAHKIEEEPALMGAFNFAITNSIGALLVLMGVALLYGRTGALNLAQIGATLGDKPADGLVVAAFVLITCGFGVKAALVPFQFWLADAHAVAAAPVCVLFSGVMVELGIYAIAHVYWSIFSGVLHVGEPPMRLVWLGFGLLTAVVGALMCYSQRHLKRLLAFSTISHTGMFLIGIALLTGDALAGTGLYVVGHGLVKGTLFLCAGVLLNRFASVDENSLRGRGKILGTTGVVFVIGGVALCGLPPFGTYTGKALIEEAAERAGYAWLPALLTVCSALTGAAVLRAGGKIFLGLGPRDSERALTPKKEQKETKENYNRAPAVMTGPAMVLLALALVSGIWPGLKDHARSAAMRFEDRSNYVSVVIKGKTPLLRVALHPEANSVSSIAYGIGGTLGAVLLAAAALFPGWLPHKASAELARWFETLLAPLRSLHSGDVVDYVTWLIAGAVTAGGLFAWLLH